MNWFQRHLNWTALAVIGLDWVTGFLMGFIAVSIDPYVSVEALRGATIVLGLVILGFGWGWVIRQKGRSLWWLPVTLFVPFGWICVFTLKSKNTNEAAS